jgi:hypothetical protein
LTVSSFIRCITLVRPVARQRPTSGSTPRRSPLAAALLGLFSALCAAVAGGPAAAQGPAFTVHGAGVIGGAFSVEGEDPGIDQTGFQLGFTWDTWEDASVGVRAARVSFSDEQLESLFDPELTYVTIAGEYQYNESFYRSGLYLGLGFYQLEGLVGLETQDDTSIGFVLGATGDFAMTERFSILVEISGHYVDFELGPQLYGFLTAGVAYHF